MSDGHGLVESLTLLSEREIDPTGPIYVRLFKDHPELEAEFVMDIDGGVRGSMLSQAFDVLIDLAEGEGRFAETILTTERQNHESYGVPPDTFFLFLSTIRDWARESLGGEWTPQMEADWADVLAQAETVSA
ncbi:MAG: globin [Pseudomonadota bacterium]